MMRGDLQPSHLSTFVVTVGDRLGAMVDFPYSPVRLVVLMLPEGFSLQDIILVRAAAGLAYFISLLSVLVFVVVIWGYNWPMNSGSFNVWVNLPNFDPTSRGDVVERLERDGRVNIALGFLLPFIIPAFVQSAGNVFGTASAANPHTVIWTVAAWAFLPSSLFARGLAMMRVGKIIARKRRESTRSEEELVPA